MPKERLTDTRIAAFSPSQEEWLRDTETRLQVRGRPTGSKTFIFRSTLNYREVRITIGEVGAVTLPDARKKALMWQGWIADGKDPREVLRQQEQALAAEKAARIAAEDAAALASRRRTAPAMEAWSAYIEARRPKWGAHSLHDHERVSQEGGKPFTRGRRSGPDDTTQPGALRPLLLLPLAQIDAERVRVWMTEEAARRPTHAALAFRLLRSFLNWCATRPEYADQTHADACAARSVRDEIPKKRVKDDCLQREQLRPWFEKVRQIPNPVIASYLQVALLIGARREEVAGLRWGDINFQWSTIHIADKVDGERVIPLTPYVAALLAALPRRNEWVFSSPTAESGRLQEPRIQHKRACAAAGVEDLTIHGLRRSFGTLSEWVEVPVGIVAQIMGHKPSATAERHYRRRPVDLLRQWHTKIETWILTEAGIEQPSAVRALGLRAVS
jgi:integrase